MSDSSDTDILVIGAGLAGAASARSLAERGRTVTVVERDVPASAAGSSHGSARIFRYAYPDPFWVRLVRESRLGWDELERRSGRRLITPSGSLDFGAVRAPAALAEVLAAQDVEHELLSAREAAARWPQIGFDTEVLWHPGAGVIDAEGAVLAQLELARQSGAQVLDGWEAAQLRRTSSGYSVESTTGARIHAKQVIVAAGGWLTKVLAEAELPASFVERLPQVRVTQENAYHFPYRDAADTGEVPEAGRSSWPTFIHKSAALQTYSLPGGRDAAFRGQKLAEYDAGPRLADASQQDGRIDPANRDRIVEYVRRQLPGLVPEPYAETTCLFTMLPGEDFLIDRAEGVIVVSPCSGHGAKFAPLIGELAADLAEGAAPVERFAASGRRFEAAA